MSVKVMVIGAHNDECEYGIGGIAALLAEKGCDILFVNPCGAFHRDDASADAAEEWIRQENRAAEVLGAKKVVFDNRREPLYRSGHEAVLQLEKIMTDFMPDILLIHWPEDNHLEHRMTAHDSYNAACLASVHGVGIKEIYAFEAGPGQTGQYFIPDFSIEITAAMPKLRESLLCFDQPTAKGAFLYCEKEIAALYRGHVCGAQYAECLKIVKYPCGNDDFLLKSLLNEHFRWSGNGMYPAKGRSFF